MTWQLSQHCLTPSTSHQCNQATASGHSKLLKLNHIVVCTMSSVVLALSICCSYNWECDICYFLGLAKYSNRLQWMLQCRSAVHSLLLTSALSLNDQSLAVAGGGVGSLVQTVSPGKPGPGGLSSPGAGDINDWSPGLVSLVSVLVPTVTLFTSLASNVQFAVTLCPGTRRPGWSHWLFQKNQNDQNCESFVNKYPSSS